MKCICGQEYEQEEDILPEYDLCPNCGRHSSTVEKRYTVFEWDTNLKILMNVWAIIVCVLVGFLISLLM